MFYIIYLGVLILVIQSVSGATFFFFSISITFSGYCRCSYSDDSFLSFNKYVNVTTISHFNTAVLNSIWLLVLQVPPTPSFISIQFFFWNIDKDGWFGVLSNKLCYFLEFHCYYNIRSLTIFCFYFLEIYIFL